MRARATLRSLRLGLALAALLAAGPVLSASRPDIVWLDCEGPVFSEPAAVVFPRAFAQAPATWPRRAAIAAGRYPEDIGAFDGLQSLSSGTVLLAEVLKTAGYSVAGFDGAAPAAAWLRSNSAGPAHAFVAQRGGCEAAARALRQAARPGSIVAVSVYPGTGSAAGLSEKELRSALLLEIPGKSGRRVDDVIELIDLAPTLLDLAGLAIPASFEGRSLVPSIAGPGPGSRAAFSASARAGRGADLFSIRTARWRLTYDKAAGTARLFDLDSDPEGLRDVLRDHAAEALPLLRQLLAHVRKTGTAAQRPGSPSQELLDELIEKGYW